MDSIFAMAVPGEPSRGKSKIVLRILYTSSVMNSSQINILKKLIASYAPRAEIAIC